MINQFVISGVLLIKHQSWIVIEIVPVSKDGNDGFIGCVIVDNLEVVV